MRPATALAPETPPAADETAWVRRACAGESVAFQPLVERHQARVFNLCLRLLGRRPDAEDAAQEAFVRAYQSLPRFDLARPFAAWLIEIAVNVCRDRRRSAWWRRVWLGDEELPATADEAEGADQRLSRSAELRALVAALQELKTQDREALAVLAEELPAAEAARALGITANALYVRQSRARVRLAALLRARHPDLFEEAP